MLTAKQREISRWMRNNFKRFIDTDTGEINYTLMVETWDIEQADGKQTLDAKSSATWTIALLYHEEF